MALLVWRTTLITSPVIQKGLPISPFCPTHPSLFPVRPIFVSGSYSFPKLTPHLASVVKLSKVADTDFRKSKISNLSKLPVK